MEEMNVSEPLMKRRKGHKPHQNPSQVGVAGITTGGHLECCPWGVRRRGGMTSIQALRQNTGTTQFDVKGVSQVGKTHKRLSTDAN